jgi:hypothetical protein
VDEEAITRAGLQSKIIIIIIIIIIITDRPIGWLTHCLITHLLSPWIVILLEKQTVSPSVKFESFRVCRSLPCVLAGSR